MGKFASKITVLNCPNGCELKTYVYKMRRQYRCNMKNGKNKGRFRKNDASEFISLNCAVAAQKQFL